MEKEKITIRDIYLPEGTILDHRYQILRVLGRGGFGITYEAVNQKVNRRVAIKEFYSGEYMGREGNTVILTDGRRQETFEKAKKKFMREARLLGDMSEEPGVVQVLDYFEENNTAYIVMAYVSGSSLSEYFRKKGRIAPVQMLQILFPLMQTLDKVHKYGVIHRDISPENIKFTDDEEKEVRLIDFGSARDMMDNTHTIELTEGYAPPEQYSGHEQGPWTDVYSLCAVAYQGITGQRPASSVFRVSHDELLMPSQLGISIEPALEKILKKGLNVRIEKRYQSVGEILTELQPLLYPKNKKGRRNKKEKIFLAVSSTVFLLAVGILAGWKYYQDHLAYFKFHGERTETVLLVPYDDMGSQDYKKDTETIRKRLKYVVGDDGYILKEREDGLELTMSLAFFKEGNEYKNLDYDITQTIKQYISQPQQIAVSLVGESESKHSQGAYWPISRDDIVSVKRKDGKMPVESKMPSKYRSDMDIEYDSYIEIKISEEAAERIRQSVEQKQKEMEGMTLYTVLLTDPGDTNRLKMALETDFDGDWTTYYMECQKGKNWWKALFETPELSEAFQIVQEIPVDWEEKNGMWGKYQKQESEIQEPSVTVRYEVWLTGFGDRELKEGSGQWTEVMYDLKKKLDTLELPYAIGLSPDKSEKIVVKMAQKDTNLFLQKSVLGGASFSLSVEDPEMEPYDFYGGKLEVSEEPYGLWYTPENNTQKERLQEWLKQVTASGSKKVYLWMGGYRIAWLEAESDKMTSLNFLGSCMKSGGKFEEKDLSFLKFVHKVYDVEKSNDYSYDSYFWAAEQYSTEKQKVTADKTVQNEELMPETEEFDEAENVVKKVDPEAVLREDRTSVEQMNLYIHLRYDLKKAYAGKFVSDVERILSEGEDKLKKYSKIYIIPGDTETRSLLAFIKNDKDGKWTLQYRYESAVNTEEEQVREEIRNSTVLKPYLTEDSLEEDMGWWWFNYDFL